MTWQSLEKRNQKQKFMKRKIYIILFLAVTVFLLVTGLGWLAIGGLLFCVLYVLFTSKLKPVVWFKKNTLLSATFTLIGVFLLAIGVRVFMFEIYGIPSGSMENTLVLGDKVLVSKLNYGPRLPRSPFEIPWLNIFFYLNKSARAKSDSAWWDYKRLHGYTLIRRGDIIVFQFPDDEKEAFIKRCVALPGDTFQIRNSEIFVNNRQQDRPLESKLIYRVWYNNIQEFNGLTDSLNIPVYGAWYREQKDFKEINLSQLEKEELTGHSCIDSITSKITIIDSTAHVFPWHNRYSWTIDQYGPVIIPEKGMKIEMNEGNYVLYRKILEKFEHFQPEKRDGEIFLNNTEVNEYTFKQDYYFMMGDNRHRSNDSRMWGLVPEEYIVGKAVVILFSKDYNGLKWNRCLKGL